MNAVSAPSPSPSPSPSAGPLHATHEVLNQPAPMAGHNLFDLDPALRDAITRHGAAFDVPNLRALGAQLGLPEWIEHGHNANVEPPKLRLFDRFGHRINQVAYHPSYHALMAESKRWRIDSLAWVDRRPGALVARLGRSYLMGQVEQGHGCPITMTFASVPALRHQPDVAAFWLPKILSGAYDGDDRPAPEKAGVTIGMAMTEKQGGSDVRANTTQATPVSARSGPGAAYRLVGHKWFCSAPMCDAFLTLAQTPRGLSCFLVPRWAPEGDADALQAEAFGGATRFTRNPIWVQRLKDKVGNRSNASSEVEYHGALGWMVGGEGRGVATILEMVAHTRLDCIVGSAATIRQVVSQAAWHARGRSAFGGRLADKPLMRNVLADLHLESEAAIALGLRIGRAWDEARAHDDGARPSAGPSDAAPGSDSRPFARIATAIAKYHVCKIAPTVAYEAMECLGGGGFVEESPIGRHFRDAPVNSIWEGSGNVICLDVLRAMAREPESLSALRDELSGRRGLDDRYDAALLALERELADGGDLELRARGLVERLALQLQGAVLLAAAAEGAGQAAVADAFCASRLRREGATRHFGTLPRGVAVDALLERCLPA